jgi:hypothetical protein
MKGFMCICTYPRSPHPHSRDAHMGYPDMGVCMARIDPSRSALSVVLLQAISLGRA